MVLKTTNCRQVQRPTAAAAWGRMTVGQSEDGLAAAVRFLVLVVWWLLMKKWCVDECHLVKTVEVYLSGSRNVTKQFMLLHYQDINGPENFPRYTAFYILKGG